MQILDALKAAWSIFGGRTVAEAWATSEAAFEEHFEAPYEEFEARVSQLDQAHSALYEQTLEINPEAAICWVFFITS